MFAQYVGNRDLSIALHDITAALAVFGVCICRCDFDTANPSAYIFNNIKLYTNNTALWFRTFVNCIASASVNATANHCMRWNVHAEWWLTIAFVGRLLPTKEIIISCLLRHNKQSNINIIFAVRISIFFQSPLINIILFDNLTLIRFYV